MAKTKGDSSRFAALPKEGKLLWDLWHSLRRVLDYERTLAEKCDPPIMLFTMEQVAMLEGKAREAWDKYTQVRDSQGLAP